LIGVPRSVEEEKGKRRKRTRSKTAKEVEEVIVEER
jgi:hypothetical protein